MSRQDKWNYEQELQSGMWLSIKRQVLARDSFRCVNCGASDMPLHVHHLYYKHGRKAWQYPLDALQTLCVDCHDAEHSDDPEIAFQRALDEADEDDWLEEQRNTENDSTNDD